MTDDQEQRENIHLWTQPATTDMYDGISKAIVYFQSRGVPPESKNLIEAQGEIQKAIPAYLNDIWIYRWAIYILGAVLILGLCFITILALLNVEIPTVIGNLASIAIGVLAGLFAPQGLRR
jgi:hypothetical protein